MIPNYLPNEQIAMCRMSQDQAISYWTSTGWMGLTYKNTEIHVEDWAWDIKSHSVCNLGNIVNNVLIPSRAGKAVYSVGILYPYPPPKQNTMLNVLLRVQVLLWPPEKMTTYINLVLKLFHLEASLLIIIFALSFFHFLLRANKSFSCPYLKILISSLRTHLKVSWHANCSKSGILWVYGYYCLSNTILESFLNVTAKRGEQTFI